jgi:hypothetical protein
MREWSFMGMIPENTVCRPPAAYLRPVDVDEAVALGRATAEWPFGFVCYLAGVLERLAQQRSPAGPTHAGNRPKLPLQSQLAGLSWDYLLLFHLLTNPR